MAMADEKTWCCFIIGDKERAEEQAGGRAPRIHKWGTIYVWCLAWCAGQASPHRCVAVSRPIPLPSPRAFRVHACALRGWRLTEVPDIFTGR